MTRFLYRPELPCEHDIRPTSGLEGCVIRCSKCDEVLECVYYSHCGGIGGWLWRPRTERWLRRKLRKNK